MSRSSTQDTSDPGSRRRWKRKPHWTNSITRHSPLWVAVGRLFFEVDMARKPRNQDINFFEELASSAINLPVAVQDELAAMVSRAYSSQTLGVPQDQISALPFAHPLADQYLPA